jgi:hypothetical protein
MRCVTNILKRYCLIDTKLLSLPLFASSVTALELSSRLIFVFWNQSFTTVPTIIVGNMRNNKCYHGIFDLWDTYDVPHCAIVRDFKQDASPHIQLRTSHPIVIQSYYMYLLLCRGRIVFT